MARLQILEISLKLEELIFKNAPNWQPDRVEDLLDKICYLGMATAGTGFIELNEWDEINLTKIPSETQSMTLGELTSILENARRLVEWSSSMMKANLFALLP